jgi:hypothetical protein
MIGSIKKDMSVKENIIFKLFNSQKREKMERKK